MQQTSYLHHKERPVVPRHLQSHAMATLEPDDTHLYRKPQFVGCLVASAIKAEAKPVQKPLDEDQLPAMSTLQKMTNERQALCEKWLDEYIDSVNQKHCVSFQLAFENFAPSHKEKLSSIYCEYSGAAK